MASTQPLPPLLSVCGIIWHLTQPHETCAGEGRYLVDGFNWTSELMCGIFTTSRRRNGRFWRSRPRVYLPRYVAQSTDRNKLCFVNQNLGIMAPTQKTFALRCPALCLLRHTVYSVHHVLYSPPSRDLGLVCGSVVLVSQLKELQQQRELRELSHSNLEAALQRLQVIIIIITPSTYRALL